MRRDTPRRPSSGRSVLEPEGLEDVPFLRPARHEALESTNRLPGEVLYGGAPLSARKLDGLGYLGLPTSTAVGQPDSIDPGHQQRDAGTRGDGGRPRREGGRGSEEVDHDAPPGQITVTQYGNQASFLGGCHELGAHSSFRGIDRYAETTSVLHEQIEETARLQHLGDRGGGSSAGSRPGACGIPVALVPDHD